ncbi:DUF2339 domain-containing protein [Pontibacter qinzhouensis]|uniref:DUF2339 domain-containing protein n=1 Tax=Pontibacter qinzhouensis TaxID=2603253 RepID=A0A5C8JB29_9BACT|nr:DUF2339 domain-containing protein [Pontibacter qinzhouensis]TXK33887.1 DUF2339 domain-containing protein [Pontibacter qinzhouensis]
MEIFLLLLLVVMVLWFGNQLLTKVGNQSQEIRFLNEEIQKLREQVKEQRKVTPSEVPPLVAQPIAAPVPPRPIATPPPPIPKPAPVPREQPLQEPAIPSVPVPVPPMAAFTTAVPPSETVEAPVETASESIFSNFRKNLDWEKFIGENLINKLGIAILVLGIGFFVKYAIDQDWINEVGRVAIGILAGGALLGVAHRLRKDYKAFSSVLVGGGMAVLYFTIAIAFHEYQLFSQTVAFLIMVVITGFTIFLAVAYDRMELAVLALIGGFGSPFMISTGEGNYVVLFTFVLTLNLGILVLAYFKKWNLLNIIAYVFTIILYSGWLTTRVVGEADPPYTGALVFATIFYLVFFLMNIINNLREQRKFTAPEIMMLLSNTFLYYSAGMYVLQQVAEGAYQGLFTAAIAVFNFGFAYLLYQNQKADRNLVYLLIGLVLTFLSLAAPVQLEGNYITLFWALEAVLLLWLSQRSGIALIRVASVVVLALMFGSLLIDWTEYNASYTVPLRIVFNKLFVTGLVAVSALAATLWLLRQETELVLIRMLPVPDYRAMVGVLLVICLYLTLLLELRYQLIRYEQPYSTTTFILAFYNYLFLVGLLLFSKRLYLQQLTNAITGLAVLAIVLYLALLHPTTMLARDLYLTEPGQKLSSFTWHYLPLVLVVVLMALVLRLVHQQLGFKSKIGKVALWFMSFVAVFILSAELEHLALLSSYSPGSTLAAQLAQIRKIGFAILWGICSFAFMSIGMSYKLKTLRIISLSLFFLTLLKLFLFDIRGISEGGKIAAFICLGIILLVVSFMYQKLKVLILEDDANAATVLPDTPADAPQL